MNAKIGMRVRVADKAWSKCYNRPMDVGRIRRNSLGGELNVFDVIGEKCKLWVEDNRYANTLIRDTSSGAIWAVNDCNLEPYEPVKVVFMMGSTDITASLTNAQKYTLIVDFIGRER